MKGDIMSLMQVAIKLGVSIHTVRSWIVKKHLKANLTPRGYQITENQLQDYLKNHKK
jgi:excisionase family DNA binding protein